MKVLVDGREFRAKPVRGGGFVIHEVRGSSKLGRRLIQADDPIIPRIADQMVVDQEQRRLKENAAKVRREFMRRGAR